LNGQQGNIRLKSVQRTLAVQNFLGVAIKRANLGFQLDTVDPSGGTKDCNRGLNREGPKNRQTARGSAELPVEALRN
jgi:hypothetical protein